jgi:hypothetical protein
MSRLRGLLCATMLATSLLITRSASAHKPSDSYLTLESVGNDIDVRWDIAVRDLDFAVGVDRDGDGTITWGELLAAQSSIVAYAQSRLTMRRADRTCAASALTSPRLVHHSDGTYVVLAFAMTCPRPASADSFIDLDYRLLFDVDPQHRGIAHLVDGNGQTVIFDIDHATARLSPGHPAPWRDLRMAIRSGVHHIWSGYDHLLFLLALLLPCMLRRTVAGTWEGVSSPRPAFRRIATVVTAFTLAHSLTLSLAALDLVRLPSRLVETLIAASVVAAAMNNVLPFAQTEGWMIAFALGLLHGFGFAGALTDAGLSGTRLAATLFGFNVGVELGQLTLVVLFVPVAFSARNTLGYRRVVLIGGSGAIAAVSLVWLVQRALS